MFDILHQINQQGMNESDLTSYDTIRSPDLHLNDTSKTSAMYSEKMSMQFV